MAKFSIIASSLFEGIPLGIYTKTVLADAINILLLEALDASSHNGK